MSSNKDWRYKHGMNGTRFHSIWRGVKHRVNVGPNVPKHYKDYVMRGIKLYEPWNNFINFMNDTYQAYKVACDVYGEKNVSLDRIDNDGNYEPSNIRWVDQKTQSRNTRTNHYLTVNGVKKTLGEWSELYHISYSAITHRLKKGWSETDAVTKPLRKLQTVEYKNKEYTYEELSNMSGIPLDTLRNRISRHGWSVNKAVETQVVAPNRNRLVTIGNETKKLSEFCNEYNMRYATVISRLKKGLSYEEALAIPKFTEMTATINGKTQTLTQWSEELGIKYGTVLYRIHNQGVTPEEALTTPLYTEISATIDGITKPVTQWCNEFKINCKTIYDRISRGMTPEEALKSPIRGTQTATINGETKTVKEWCDTLGLKYKTVRYRMRLGVSAENAILLPKGSSLPKDKI